jgi:hypothetical protein
VVAQIKFSAKSKAAEHSRTPRRCRTIQGRHEFRQVLEMT